MLKTQKSDKADCEYIHHVLKGKKIKELDDKESLAVVLKLFKIEARIEDGTTYSKVP